MIKCHRDYESIISKISKAEKQPNNAVTKTFKIDTLGPKYFFASFKRPFLILDKISRNLSDLYISEEEELIANFLNELCHKTINVNYHSPSFTCDLSEHILNIFKETIYPTDWICISEYANDYIEKYTDNEILPFFKKVSKRDCHRYLYETMLSEKNYFKITKLHKDTCTSFFSDLIIASDAVFINSFNFDGKTVYELPIGFDGGILKLLKNGEEKFLKEHGLYTDCHSTLTISVDPDKIYRIEGNLS